MDNSTFYFKLEKISKKYNINFEDLLELCEMTKTLAEPLQTGTELETIYVNSSRYYYNDKNSYVYTTGKVQKLLGKLCPTTFQIIEI